MTVHLRKDITPSALARYAQALRTDTLTGAGATNVTAKRVRAVENALHLEQEPGAAIEKFLNTVAPNLVIPWQDNIASVDGFKATADGVSLLFGTDGENGAPLRLGVRLLTDSSGVVTSGQVRQSNFSILPQAWWQTASSFIVER